MSYAKGLKILLTSRENSTIATALAKFDTNLKMYLSESIRSLSSVIGYVKYKDTVYAITREYPDSYFVTFVLTLIS